MKKKRTIFTLVFLIMILILLSPALAVTFEDFSDVSGHWAEKTLKRGFSDGLIQGFGNGTLRPDQPITAAQMITILCRVLSVPDSEEPAPSIPADAWYAEDAAKAYSLGLITANAADLDAPMTRQDALAMLSKAFRIIPALPPLSAIASLPDYGDIHEENRPAMAVLFSEGYIQGYGGYLNIDTGITRGEFLTVLYRIAENYIPASSLSSNTSGASVIKDSGSIISLSLVDKLWFDCSVKSVSLSGVTSEYIAILNKDLESFTAEMSSLGCLVLSGCARELKFPTTVTAESLRLEGAISASLHSNIDNVSLTGSGASISLSGEHSSLVLAGSNNSVVLSDGCSVNNIIIAGENNKLITEGSACAENLDVTGKGCQLSFSGSVTDSVSLSGISNVASLQISSGLNTLSVSDYGNWLNLTGGAISSATVGGSYSVLNKDGGGIISSLRLTGTGCSVSLSEGSVSSLAIPGIENTVNLNTIAQNVIIDGRKNTLSGSGLAENVTLNVNGCDVSVAVSSLTNNSFEMDAERVLALISSNYRGNFTLKWAQQHDYEPYDKEVFVNAKGYGSKSEYLIWVNRAMQRVNIFKGSSENWQLTHSSIVATGATRSLTPVGVYDITYKLEAGWTTSTYTCRPVVGFNKGTGYALHSRLYYPRSRVLTDAQIGFPISHGCVRMYDEDIWYIYNNIPIGTTLVVY